jgi:mannan endo-1,4-beta-mannosidase
MITTGGEGQFYWKDKNVGFWFNGTFVFDYNFNGEGWKYEFVWIL